MTEEKLDISFVYAEFQYLESFEDIAVAVSGGADSMALLLLLREWYLNLMSLDGEPPRIHVLTVDHGLRPEAADETAWVKNEAEKLGFNCVVLKWLGEKPRSGIQEEARKARYNLMADWCRQNHIPAILTAHHMDDQAETVIMRLARGAGVKGLAGVSGHYLWGDMNIIRPLLNISKAQLKWYLKDRDQKWIEDPGNSSDNFERVRIRKSLPVLKEFNIDTVQLARTAARLRRAENALDSWTEKTLRKSLICMPEGLVTVNWRCFQEVPEEIQLRVLSKALKVVGGRKNDPSLSGLEDQHAELIRKGNFVTTLSGCIIQREKTKLIISREVRGNDSHQVNIEPGDRILWDNRFEVSLSSDAASGYSIGFLTESGYLKLLDNNLQTSSLPELLLQKLVRNSLPALFQNNLPVCVPALHYTSKDFPENVLKIEFQSIF